MAATSATIQIDKRTISEGGRLGASDTDVESGQDEAPGIVRVRDDGLCREWLHAAGSATPLAQWNPSTLDGVLGLINTPGRKFGIA